MSSSPTAGSPASGGGSGAEAHLSIGSVPQQSHYSLDDNDDDDDDEYHELRVKNCYHHCNDVDICDSDTSEVLSVGNEPAPTFALENLESRVETSSKNHQTDSFLKSLSTAGSVNNTDLYPEVPSADQGATDAVVATSTIGVTKGSDSATASRYKSKYQVCKPEAFPISRLRSDAAAPATAVVYSEEQEKLHHCASINVPLAEVSLLPTSAMTVTGIQVTTPVVHPIACRGELTRDLTHHHHHGAVAAAVLQHIQHALGTSHIQPVVTHNITPTTVVHDQQRHTVLQQRISPDSILFSRAEKLQQQIKNDKCFSLSTSRLVAASGTVSNIDKNHDSNITSNNVNNNSNNNNNTQHQANLKFSIDNILKADFGRRITDPISLKKSRQKKSQLTGVRPIDLSKDFFETSSEGSERGSERGSETSSTRNVSPSLPVCSPASNSTPTSNTESKAMQWPAWVYCTRYSDRPSSGKFFICYIFLIFSVLSLRIRLEKFFFSGLSNI